MLARVFCDHEGCENVLSDVARNQGGTNKTWVLWLARREGWAVSKNGSVTYCPEHRKYKAKARG
jgi:hypothetical protein